MPILAGQKLRASDLNAVIPIFGYATADTTKTSNTTLADATGLMVALEASKRYALDGYLAYNAGATGDLKLAWTVPASTTGSWTAYALSSASTGSIGTIDGRRITAYGAGSTYIAGGSDSFAGELACVPHGYIVTAGTSGVLQLQFAQSVSSATSTIIKAGSWVRIQELI